MQAAHKIKDSQFLLRNYHKMHDSGFVIYIYTRGSSQKVPLTTK